MDPPGGQFPPVNATRWLVLDLQAGGSELELPPIHANVPQ